LIEERVALAADRVPTFYLDAWARLQSQRQLRPLANFSTFRAMAGRGDSFGSSKASESKVSARNMCGPMADETFDRLAMKGSE